jgi:hypothetical protein
MATTPSTPASPAPEIDRATANPHDDGARWASASQRTHSGGSGGDNRGSNSDLYAGRAQADGDGWEAESESVSMDVQLQQIHALMDSLKVCVRMYVCMHVCSRYVCVCVYVCCVLMNVCMHT